MTPADKQTVSPSERRAGGRPLARGHECKILEAYFDFLERSLFDPDRVADIGQLRNLLMEIGLFLQSNRTQILSAGYNRLLNRLTRIYARGLKHPENQAYTATADKYADVLGVVRKQHGDYDYSEAFGLLLYYMNQLFHNRKSSWIEIYEQLLSLSDVSQIPRSVITPELEEIQCWVEEGVANLFQLREDQLQQIAELRDQQREVGRHINATHREMRALREAFAQDNVVSINCPLKRHELDLLLLERQDLAEDLEVKQRVVELLDENIHEFEEKLLETRRKCLIHAL